MENVIAGPRNPFDRILRPGTVQSGPAAGTFLRLIVLVVLSGAVYGAVMGTFEAISTGNFLGERAWQVLFAAVKLPILLLAVLLVSLLSAFVLSVVAGIRRDFAETAAALLATHAGLALVLACLSPCTILWYVFCHDYEAAVRFNGLVLALASLAGLWLLHGYYRPLIQRNARHQWVFWTWWPIFLLVGIQLMWVLRPFVGNPVWSTQFLRPETWGNAYTALGDLIYRAL